MAEVVPLGGHGNLAVGQPHHAESHLPKGPNCSSDDIGRVANHRSQFDVETAVLGRLSSRGIERDLDALKLDVELGRPIAPVDDLRKGALAPP